MYLEERKSEPDDGLDNKYIHQDLLTLPDTYIDSTKRFLISLITNTELYNAQKILYI